MNAVDKSKNRLGICGFILFVQNYIKILIHNETFLINFLIISFFTYIYITTFHYLLVYTSWSKHVSSCMRQRQSEMVSLKSPIIYIILDLLSWLTFVFVILFVFSSFICCLSLCYTRIHNPWFILLGSFYFVFKFNSSKKLTWHISYSNHLYTHADMQMYNFISYVCYVYRHLAGSWHSKGNIEANKEEPQGS